MVLKLRADHLELFFLLDGCSATLLTVARQPIFVLFCFTIKQPPPTNGLQLIGVLNPLGLKRA